MKIPDKNVATLIGFPVGSDFRIDAMDWESVLTGAAQAIAHCVGDSIAIYEWTDDGYTLAGHLHFTDES